MLIEGLFKYIAIKASAPEEKVMMAIMMLACLDLKVKFHQSPDQQRM
jgi:hypothetical protein